MAENSGMQDERPGVELAYGLIQSSYDWTVSRLNAVENRIQALMVFSASFIVTAPALVAAAGSIITLESPLFYFGLGMAGLNLIIGNATRAWGGIKLLGINNIADEWLGLPVEWFKLYAVERASEHFTDNVKTVNKKSQLVILMTILFLLETVFLVGWSISQIR